MKAMMEKSVLPGLKQRFQTPAIFHKTVLTQGIGESFLADMIKDWEDALPTNLKLAYLPGLGTVKLRLSGTGDNAETLQNQVMEEIKKMLWIIDDFVFGFDDDSLEQIVGQLLTKKEATLSTAESCTGGYIAHRITTVPGSSNYYMGSVVAYANLVKENFLDVPVELMNEHGAVSEEVAKVMAENAARKFKTTYAIASTGIAGPDGATPGKPVGTVWIAISTPEGCFTRKLALGSTRLRIISETSLNALNMLRKILVGKHAYDEAAAK
jgi:nicotinamide-nucleotide amidase